MKPLVSVCILSQNHQAFIEDLINSLNEQTEKNFEVLFVDNCSDDKTYETGLEAIQKYGLRHTYSVKNETRKNIPSNLNLMMRHVQGENVLIISADDWLTPDSIFIKLRHLIDNPDCVAVCSSLYVYNNDTGEKYVQEVSSHIFSNQFEALMLNEFGLSTPGAMYRREALEKVGFFDESIEVEDFDMWLKMARAGRIGCIVEPLAFYRRHGNNISADETKKIRWMIENVVKSMRKYKDSPVYDVATRKLYRRIFFDRFYNVETSQSFTSKLKALSKVLKLGKYGIIASYYFVTDKILGVKG